MDKIIRIRKNRIDLGIIFRVKTNIGDEAICKTKAFR